MTITFIGHGYVGLVTACVFANFGNTVWVVGHTARKIQKLKNGDPIIYEPGLKELLEKNIKAKRINFTLDIKEAVSKSEIIFITVGTPPKKNGEADLSTVLNVAKNIGKSLETGFSIVSCKSTVPVGTNKKIEEAINRNKSKSSKVAVASCPEFLREGTALQDTLSPDRIVIGSESKIAIDKILELHQPIGGKRIITDLASAELIKYASNAMLACKVSYANLISFYCEKTMADVETVLDAVGIDNRIGRVFLYPGVGYGGSCLPKDVKALVNIGKKLEIDTKMLDGIEEVNKQAAKYFLQKIIKNASGKNIAIWGLSFKPNTDDIRFAPSIYIIQELLKKGFKITVYDPEAMDNIKTVFGNSLNYANNPYEAVKDASSLCILTEWDEFKQISMNKVKKYMKNYIIFDGRNIYSPTKMKDLGFKYFGIGRNI